MPQIGRYPENMTIAQTIQMIKDTRKVSESELILNFRSFRTGKYFRQKKNAHAFRGTTQKVSAVLAFYSILILLFCDEPRQV